ncbi:Alpha-glucosidase [subsurface metagenome]
MFNDIYLSDVLEGSTIVLHDIDKTKLEMIYELLLAENERLNNKFNLERTTDRSSAFKGADFIINSIEVGERYRLWRQDFEIPRKHGSHQILGECGGPGGSFHAWRIIPPILDIVKDAEKICPNAFFINFSNPLSRVCLAIKRSVKDLKYIGLCHQIGFMVHHLPRMFNKSIKKIKMKVGGLNHFAFLLGLEDLSTGKDLIPKFKKKALNYFREHENRFEFSTLTFEFFKRFVEHPR